MYFWCLLVVGSVCSYGSLVYGFTLQQTPPKEQSQISITPPPTFPTKNSSSTPIYKNKTIEEQFLRHNNLPPKTFPTNSSTKNYLILKSNDSIIDKLLHKTTAQPPNPEIPPFVFPKEGGKFKVIEDKDKEKKFLGIKEDTEVGDLLEGKEYEGQFDVDQINPKFQKKVERYVIQNRAMAGHMGNGPLAGVLIGVLVVIALFGYLSLVMWRRSLEHKYGFRERLVNEEDFDPELDQRFEVNFRNYD